MESVFKLAAIYSVVDKMSGPVKRMAGTVLKYQAMMNKAEGWKKSGMIIGTEAAVINETAEKMKNSFLSLVAPAARVEDAVAKLSTVTTPAFGSMRDALAASKNAALDWSKKHLDAVDVYLAANTQMASAGLNSVQAIAGTEAALSAARANMGDVGESTELLATLYNNMGDKAGDAGQEMTKLADVLTVTMQAFQIKDLNTLGEGLKYAVPSALQFKLSIQEVNTVIGMLNNSGLKGGQAGTSFAAAMRNMNKASAELGFSIAKTADGGTDFIKTLENIKGRYGDFSSMTDAQQEAFKQAFGDEGLRVISLLLNKTGDLNRALQDITNSAGATAQALGTIEGTSASQAAIAMQALDALIIRLGERLLASGTLVNTILPGFIGFIEVLGDLAVGFMETFPGFTTFIVSLGAIVFGFLAIAGPIMVAASAIMLFGGNALKVFAYIKEGLWKLYYYAASGELSEKITALKNSMVSAFNTGRAAILRCADGMKTFAASVWQSAKAMATAAAQGIKNFVTGLVSMARQAIVTAATALPALISSVWAFTAALLANPMTWVVLGIMALIGAIVLCVVYWDDIRAAAATAWDAISVAAAAAFEWLKGVFSGIVTWLGDLLDSFLSFGAAVWNTLAGGAVAIFDFYVGIWSSIFGLVRSAITGAVDFLGGLAGTFFTSGAALWEAFTGGIMSVLSGPVAAVQKGLALVRDLLPFSDAKTGPLSQLTENGRRLLSTIGEGVRIEAPRLSDTVGSALDFSGRFGEKADVDNAPDGRQLVIQGNVIIQVEKMDNPKDFANVFKSLSMQLGG